MGTLLRGEEGDELLILIRKVDVESKRRPKRLVVGISDVKMDENLAL